ncbi:metal ABC transporter solute-binding protein, Zn/Mn family [Erysipelothrix rhusiopathiae]|uniref:metal ABC transporter solute-binding protein, Zn/Mn family n=1 Tax=Erysipelothrix rhusiopathiae TaxID=1648 RepID=UPI000F4363A4|nr:zinc ABC transporter substrate-binding protein [Erysipelothrix rhusiopathiae]AYV34158.1 zinc ABC transporter substrate-binding protein [Erysipelothrix rhusiopathiae]
MKKLGLMLLVLMMLAGCQSQKNDETGKLKVMTSFYPLYDFAQKVGGDKVEVENIIEGGEAHGYEPSANDIIRIQESDVFIMNGAGFEGWAPKTLKSVKNDKLKIVDTSQGVTLHEGHDHHDHDDHDDHDHHHGEYDPHIWMNPMNAYQQMKNIKDAFVEVDPENKDYYEENFKRYGAEFESLSNDFENKLRNVKNKEVVVDHTAYGYMLEPYGIEQVAIAGSLLSSEPTAKQVDESIQYIKSQNIKAIYMESLSNDKLLQTISKETGVKILKLNTLESLSKQDLENGNDYFKVMNENLESLVEGLSL